MMLLALVLLAFPGAVIVGTQAPEWNNQQWIHSKPLTLMELKGKVVLLRFLMDSSCPMCRASAPYLNEFYEQYKDSGLVVIGMYTPKPYPRDVKLETVRKYVEDYKFEFPVALDNDWATLKKFWLDRVPNAEFTSVSFLIDRKGTVRYIHPGGAYTERDAAKIRQQLEILIREK